MSKIAINVSAYQEGFEVDISGNAAEFASFTNHLANYSAGKFPLANKPNVHYQKSMKFLSTELLEQSNGLITVQLVDDGFRIIGDLQAFQKLVDFWDSLQNISPGEHFHLDWFCNENLLAPITSNMSFVFNMEA